MGGNIRKYVAAIVDVEVKAVSKDCKCREEVLPSSYHLQLAFSNAAAAATLQHSAGSVSGVGARTFQLTTPLATC